ncbi:Dyp-type peroxidase [Penicillium bovifimosum]|uniref:Dyp-type peroxidase n=1 Tax=Penicillium bovifimosum TaxID=126998 RepID=A0A9W9L7S2_9EURO|nr:Dyp-type peroxidase [Penicillium bovifimosum]KAJ5143325.1 Dyp-type peroxidase [Penicillium bovifimosum]
MAAPNKKNIQGDIWPRLPKKYETFVFFRITKPAEFKKHLAGLVPLLTTAEDAFKMRENIYKMKAEGTLKGLIKLSAINVAFSAKGLAKLGAEGFKDDVFNNGMYQDMTYPLPGEDPKLHQGLDDQHDWYHQFKPTNGAIHGVFTVTGDSDQTIDKTISTLIDPMFKVGKGEQSMQRIFSQSGKVLEDDREHFGWVDGISQPVVMGLDDLAKKTMKNGMKPIPNGVILVGGDEDDGSHPAWAKDGSFMVFRTYEQKVPEFVMWCASNIKKLAHKDKQAEALVELRKFSSRVMGRWPDGAPLELDGDKDPNETLDPDPLKNNQLLREKWGDEADKKFKEREEKNHTDDFNYHPDDQLRCPYASHIRKCGPRNDHPPHPKHLMLRRGIPYGPLTHPDEKAGGVSQHERGLLFVSYQSSITNGFRTVQKDWANTENGPNDRTKQCGGAQGQGIDPIIGQLPPDYRDKEDPTIYEHPAPVVNMPDIEKPVPDVNKHFIPIGRWVIPRGGEYFFTPSISGLQDTLCKA